VTVTHGSTCPLLLLCCCCCAAAAALLPLSYPPSSKLLDNVADVMPSTRVLLQSPNNQNNGAIGGNAVSGDAKGDNSRTGDARGGDARIDQKMTKVDTKIDSKVNGKLFG
jgi:hypothetical protein